MLNLLLDLFLPKRCVGCRQISTYFCDQCVRSVLQTDLFCPRCEDKSFGGLTHPHCERTLTLDGLWSLGLYQNPLKEAIRQLKYGKVNQLAPVLADIVIKYWGKYQPYVFDALKQDQGWVVIPVPLHWFRENSRGFNQSDLLAKLLAKKLGLDYCQALRRVRYTLPQVTLKRQDRKKNIRGAFEITKSYTLSSKPNVILIDDVWTTGATLKECCYQLKLAGAKKVWAITLAVA